MSEPDPVVREVVRPLRGVWGPAWLLGIGVVVAMAIRLPPLLLVWLLALLAGALLLGGMIKRRGEPEPRGTFVEWTARGIFRDRERLVDNAEIESIRCEPRAGAGVLICLGLASGEAREFSCPELTEAEAHIRALGRDPDSVTFAFATLPHLFALRVSFTTWLLACLAAGSGLAAAAVARGLLPVVAVGALVAVLLAGRELRTGEVDIGHDGVVIRWGSAPRFVPFGRLRKAHYEAHEFFGRRFTCVVLELRSGDLLRLPFEGDARAVRLALEAALARVRAGRTRALEELTRAGKSHEAWVTRLRALGNGAEADPRTPGQDADTFLRIASDATQPDLIRVSAAVAALARGDSASRLRISELAGVAVAPQLREALGRVAAPKPSDQELAASLAALEAAEAEATTTGAGATDVPD